MLMENSVDPDQDLNCFQKKGIQNFAKICIAH